MTQSIIYIVKEKRVILFAQIFILDNEGYNLVKEFWKGKTRFKIWYL